MRQQASQEKTFALLSIGREKKGLYLKGRDPLSFTGKRGFYRFPKHKASVPDVAMRGGENQMGVGSWSQPGEEPLLSCLHGRGKKKEVAEMSLGKGEEGGGL